MLWAAAYFSLSVSYWLTFPIALVASGFVLRTFIIFHDCCHGSFFKSKRANDILGTITGVLTVTPYQQWKNEHSIHHATSSNLDKRGVGDIWVMTVDEYKAASPWGRLFYRIYRNPFVLFCIGPIYVFLLAYRFNRKGARRKERINTHLTTVLIVVLYAFMSWLVGWQAFVMVQAPIFFFSGFFGIWLFYVQHQFEETYFEHEDEWSYVKAAVEGSSYYKLPKLLQWISGNIGFHHVHHLSLMYLTISWKKHITQHHLCKKQQLLHYVPVWLPCASVCGMKIPNSLLASDSSKTYPASRMFNRLSE